MNPQRHHILRELGIGPQWRLRTPADTGEVTEAPAATVAPEVAEVVAAAPMRRAKPAVETPVQASVGSTVDAAHLDWDALAGAVAECRACRLCEARRQAVPGLGDRQADWLFVGEGPSAEDDEHGEPFVGQAGKLLDAMLAAIDLRRDQNVYVTNSVKCRPPNNRPPEAAEIAACHPYLERQVALLQPKLIVALGRPAAQALLGREVKIADVRGKLLDYRGTPLIVTYHPAYLLSNQNDKARVWEDLCFARRAIAG